MNTTEKINLQLQIEKLNEKLNLLKWANRTGNEPDVYPPNRISWKAKIAEAKNKLETTIQHHEIKPIRQIK